MKAIQNDFRDSKSLLKQVSFEKIKDEKFKIQEIKKQEKIWFDQMKVFVESLEIEEYEGLKQEFLDSVNGNIFFKRLYRTN